MECKNDYKEERFDSFLNKTIILSSKMYFKKQMNIRNKEMSIIDDENYSCFLQNFIVHNSTSFSFDNIDSSLKLNNAIQSLSAIEQAVIFLLFEEELSQDEAAKILEIWSKSVSRIKIRAIGKLKKYMKGDFKNEK